MSAFDRISGEAPETAFTRIPIASRLDIPTPDQRLLEQGMTDGPFMAGVKSAVHGSYGGLKGLAAAVQEAYGADPTDTYASAYESQRKAAMLGPRVRELEQIENPVDAYAWGMGHIGSALPYLGVGLGGSLGMRGINALTRAGMSADAASMLGATAAYTPLMSGDEILQMKEAAPGMDPMERLTRGVGVGALQSVAEATVPTVMLRTPGARMPFMKGLGAQVGTEAMSETTSDVIGQMHRMDYQPGYQFDPMRTVNAAAAGAIGTAPYAAPGAAIGATAHYGEEAAGAALDAVTGRDYGSDVEAIQQMAADAVSWLGEKAADSVPDALLPYVAQIKRGAQMTQEVYENLKPYFADLSAEAKMEMETFAKNIGDTLVAFEDDIDADIPASEAIALAVKGLTDATNQAIGGAQGIAESVGGDIAAAVGSASTDGVGGAIKKIASDAADVVGKAAAKATGAVGRKLGGEHQALNTMAEIMTNKSKWTKDNITVQQLQAMDANFAKHSDNWVAAVSDMLRQANAFKVNTDGVKELRALVQKYESGAQMTTEEKARMMTLFTLSTKAQQTKADVMSFFDFDKAFATAPKDATGMPKDAQFSRSRRNDPNMGRAATQQQKAEQQLGIAGRAAQPDAAKVSQKFRSEMRAAVHGLLKKTEGGKALVTDVNALDQITDAFVNFATKLAAGKEKDYSAGAARRLRAYFMTNAVRKDTKFQAADQAEVVSFFDRIADIADTQFGFDSKQAENIEGFRNGSRLLLDDAFEVAQLTHLRSDKASTKQTDRERIALAEKLAGEVRDFQNLDQHRDAFGKGVAKLEGIVDKELAKDEPDNDVIFDARAKISGLKRALQGDRMILNDWVKRGIATEDEVQGLMQAVLRYMGRDDRLNNSRAASGEVQGTTYNYGTEGEQDVDVDTGYDSEGRQQATDEDGKQPVGEKKAQEKYAGDIREAQKPEFFGASAFSPPPASMSKADRRAWKQNPGAPVAGADRFKLIELTHAKSTSRLARGRSVTIGDWANELAGDNNPQQVHKLMTQAMDALVEAEEKALTEHEEAKKEQAKKGVPATGTLSEDREKTIKTRIKLADEARADASRRGKDYTAGSLFFDSKLNSRYRYYKLEGDDGSVMDMSAEDLISRYGQWPDETEASAIFRIAQKEGATADGKTWPFPKNVYERSMLPILINGKWTNIDAAGMTRSQMQRHQLGDMAGVEDQGKANAFLRAYLTNLGTILTTKGVADNDPLGLLDFSNGKFILSNESVKDKDGNKIWQVYLPADTVVVRMPGERALVGENDFRQSGAEPGVGRNVKNDGNARVLTFGQLMNMAGNKGRSIIRNNQKYITIDVGGDGSNTRLLKRHAVTPGKIENIENFLTPTSKREDVSRKVAQRSSESKKGVALAAVTDGKKVYDLNLRAALTSMLERNDIDVVEAMHDGKLPMETAAMLLKEFIAELKDLGYTSAHRGEAQAQGISAESRQRNPAKSFIEEGIFAAVPNAHWNNIYLYDNVFGNPVTIGELTKPRDAARRSPRAPDEARGKLSAGKRSAWNSDPTSHNLEDARLEAAVAARLAPYAQLLEAFNRALGQNTTTSDITERAGRVASLERADDNITSLSSEYAGDDVEKAIRFSPEALIRERVKQDMREKGIDSLPLFELSTDLNPYHANDQIVQHNNTRDAMEGLGVEQQRERDIAEGKKVAPLPPPKEKPKAGDPGTEEYAKKAIAEAEWLTPEQKKMLLDLWDVDTGTDKGLKEVVDYITKEAELARPDKEAAKTYAPGAVTTDLKTVDGPQKFPFTPDSIGVGKNLTATVEITDTNKPEIIDYNRGTLRQRRAAEAAAEAAAKAAAQREGRSKKEAARFTKAEGNDAAAANAETARMDAERAKAQTAIDAIMGNKKPKSEVNKADTGMPPLDLPVKDMLNTLNKLEVQPDVDTYARLIDWQAKLSNDQIYEVALELQQMIKEDGLEHGTMASYLNDWLRGNKGKPSLEAAGIKVSPSGTLMPADGQKSLSSGKGSVDTRLPETEKWVKEAVARMTGILGDKVKFVYDPDDAAGTYKDGQIWINIARSTRVEATYHEIWHGVEDILSKMGDNGQKVIDEVHKHVRTPLMRQWLAKQFADDPGAQSQFDDVRELAAYVFQRVANGEKMPLVPETRTLFGDIMKLARWLADKLGFETTERAERVNDFFEYVQSGKFAEEMENSEAVRSALGEKNGDRLIDNFAHSVQPIMEGIKSVLEFSSERVQDLGIGEYTEILRKYAGEGGKGGFAAGVMQNRIKFINRAGELLSGKTGDEMKAFASKRGGEWEKFILDLNMYMKNAGVSTEGVNALHRGFSSFNSDKVSENFEQFVADLVHYGAYKDKAGEARDIANKISLYGWHYDKNTEVFPGRPDLVTKWGETDWRQIASQTVEAAVRLAERTRTFGEKKEFTAEDGRKYWMEEGLQKLLDAGDKKADFEGRQLMRDYMASMDGTAQESMSPGMRKLTGTIMFGMNAATLPLGVFSQMLEPLQLAMRRNSLKGSLDALFRGIKDMPKTFNRFGEKVSTDEWEKLAYQIGTAPTRIVMHTMTNLVNGMHIGGTVGKWNDAFFRYNFMEQWNRSMHVEATKHAVEFLIEQAGNIKNKRGSKHSERFLKELGLTASDIAVDGNGKLKLNEKVEKAIVQYVEEAMAHPDAGSNAMWMNDPRFALLAQMKRFTFSHSKYILGRGEKELELGNAFPLLPAILAVPWMLSADGLRDTLALRDNNYRSSWSLWDYGMHGAERAGLFGRGQFTLDAQNAVQRGSNPVEALLGPAAETFGDLVRGASNGHLIDAVIDHSPGAALYR